MSGKRGEQSGAGEARGKAEFPPAVAPPKHIRSQDQIPFLLMVAPRVRADARMCAIQHGVDPVTRDVLSAWKESGVSNLWHGRGPQCGCVMLQLPGTCLGATASNGCQEGCEEGREEGGEEVSAGAWGLSNRGSRMVFYGCSESVPGRAGHELHRFA
jgi:hypothetical protein